MCTWLMAGRGGRRGMEGRNGSGESGGEAKLRGVSLTKGRPIPSVVGSRVGAALPAHGEWTHSLRGKAQLALAPASDDVVATPAMRPAALEREDGVRASSSETELVRSPGARLYMVDSEESVLLQSGDFTLSLIKHARSPLAAVVAAVGDLQWPLGKDALILRMGRTTSPRFSFCLPGPALLYGLTLPPEPAPALEPSLLSQFSAFEDFTAAGDDDGETGFAREEEYWTTAACGLERKSLGRSTSQPHEQKVGGEQQAAGARAARRIQQARRVSAVSKLLSKTLVKGAISAAAHVTRSDDDDDDDVAVANVDAVGRVVEAVESAGRSLPDTSALGPATWTLNNAGVTLLFRAIAATTATSSSSSGSVGGHVSRSASSSDLSSRLQSYSSTSSSAASRSPRSPLATAATPAMTPPAPVRSTSLPLPRHPLPPPPPPSFRVYRPRPNLLPPPRPQPPPDPPNP